MEDQGATWQKKTDEVNWGFDHDMVMIIDKTYDSLMISISKMS